jgi:hypothetical protein
MHPRDAPLACRAALRSGERRTPGGARRGGNRRAARGPGARTPPALAEPRAMRRRPRVADGGFPAACAGAAAAPAAAARPCPPQQRSIQHTHRSRTSRTRLARARVSAAQRPLRQHPEHGCRRLLLLPRTHPCRRASDADSTRHRRWSWYHTACHGQRQKPRRRRQVQTRERKARAALCSQNPRAVGVASALSQPQQLFPSCSTRRVCCMCGSGARLARQQRSLRCARACAAALRVAFGPRRHLCPATRPCERRHGACVGRSAGAALRCGACTEAALDAQRVGACKHRPCTSLISTQRPAARSALAKGSSFPRRTPIWRTVRWPLRLALMGTAPQSISASARPACARYVAFDPLLPSSVPDMPLSPLGAARLRRKLILRRRQSARSRDSGTPSAPSMAQPRRCRTCRRPSASAPCCTQAPRMELDSRCII